jgi:hypothetical protein
MIRIKIFDEDRHPSEIPRWWYNFLPDSFGEEEINHALMDWSANFWIAKPVNPLSGYGDRYLDFYDEHAYTWFMLRWT